MPETNRLTEPTMPRRPSLVPALALVLALATAALTACANPTAPTPPSTSSVQVRYSGYVIVTGKDGDADSTSSGSMRPGRVSEGLRSLLTSRLPSQYTSAW